MSTGRNSKLDGATTRGTQITEFVTIFPLATVPSSSYVRSKSIQRTHGNEVNLRIKFVRVTAGRKLRVLVCEGESDPAPNGTLPADTTVVGDPQTALDLSTDRLERNVFTIDESTVDDQGNAAYYQYDVRVRGPYLWVGIQLDGAGAAGDQAEVKAAEVLTQ